MSDGPSTPVDARPVAQPVVEAKQQQAPAGPDVASQKAATTLSTTLENATTQGTPAVDVLSDLARGTEIPVPPSPEGAAAATRADENGVGQLNENVLGDPDAALDQFTKDASAADAAAPQPTEPTQTEATTNSTQPPAETHDTLSPTEPQTVTPDAAAPQPTEPTQTEATTNSTQPPAERHDTPSPTEEDSYENYPIYEPDNEFGGNSKAVQELESVINLGKNLEKHGISGEARTKILELIADSADPSEMIEALNLSLNEIPAGPENASAATNATQQQENNTLADIKKLQEKDNLTDEEKSRLTFLKRLLMALKYVALAAIAATGLVVLGTANAPSMLSKK